MSGGGGEGANVLCQYEPYGKSGCLGGSAIVVVVIVSSTTFLFFVLFLFSFQFLLHCGVR